MLILNDGESNTHNTAVGITESFVAEVVEGDRDGSTFSVGDGCGAVSFRKTKRILKGDDVVVAELLAGEELVHTLDLDGPGSVRLVLENDVGRSLGNVLDDEADRFIDIGGLTLFDVVINDRRCRRSQDPVVGEDGAEELLDLGSGHRTGVGDGIVEEAVLTGLVDTIFGGFVGELEAVTDVSDVTPTVVIFATAWILHNHEEG